MNKSYTLTADQQKTITLKKSGDYVVTLKGQGSEATIKGAFWVKGTDTLNLNLTVIHAVPHTSANTVIKAVVDDSASATINGTILVKKGAQQTNSFLKENVLLLSKKARAEAVPNLEIEANEVKCSHAATVGRVDPEQLFYLESRGLPQSKSKALIAQGFLSEVLESTHD